MNSFFERFDIYDVIAIASLLIGMILFIVWKITDAIVFNYITLAFLGVGVGYTIVQFIIGRLKW